MISLLVLSLALSAPATATQNVAVANDSVVTQSSSSVQLLQGSPRTALGETTQSFDPLAIQPDSDVCYKIRAYIFSTGSHPRQIRETTCGPRRPSAKKIDKPEFLPLGVKTKPGEAPEK
jgi:hypothetical protein